MDADVRRLRERLVAELRRDGALTDPRVAEAFLAVPREEFVPEASPAEAYANRVVPTKYDPAGRLISSLSQPAIIALMLEQLDVRPGQRALEIGAGTGYNAALLAYLVGPGGRVTTIDLDEDTADRARAAIGRVGLGNVEVLAGDGGEGWEPGAPYDRIIVTASAWDIPPAWRRQLAPDGVLVLPLSVRGADVSTALAWTSGGFLRSRSLQPCGFMPLRGAYDWRGRTVDLGHGVRLNVDDDRELDVPGLGRALRKPVARIELDITARLGTVWNALDFWLASHEPWFCRLEVDAGVGSSAARGRRTRGALATLAGGSRHAASAEGDSLAIVTYDDPAAAREPRDPEPAGPDDFEPAKPDAPERAEPDDPEPAEPDAPEPAEPDDPEPAEPDDPWTIDQSVRLGVIGFGPSGGVLADALAEHVQAWWDSGTPDASQATIEVFPATPGGHSAPSESPVPGGRLVVGKRHTRLVVTWR